MRKYINIVNETNSVEKDIVNEKNFFSAAKAGLDVFTKTASGDNFLHELKEIRDHLNRVKESLRKNGKSHPDIPECKLVEDMLKSIRIYQRESKTPNL
jgi:hypothetical protein